jgi:plastocyanin
MRKDPFASLVVVLAAGISAVAIRAQSGGHATQTKEIQMTVKKCEFSPAIVELIAGTTIIFKVTAEDREHGFEIAGAKTGCVRIKKGETATVEYLADKPGTVQFKCCVFCGMGRGGMKGTIVVR